jgi:hypothetical protein
MAQQSLSALLMAARTESTARMQLFGIDHRITAGTGCQMPAVLHSTLFRKYLIWTKHKLTFFL